MRIRLIPLALAAALVSANGVSAQPLPQPRPLAPAATPTLPRMPQTGGATLLAPPPLGYSFSPAIPPLGYRPSAYQVWQYYGRTYQGWLRPRVIQGNGGARGYYLYNGYPFPTNVYPGRYSMPGAGNIASMVPPMFR